MAIAHSHSKKVQKQTIVGNRIPGNTNFSLIYSFYYGR